MTRRLRTLRLATLALAVFSTLTLLAARAALSQSASTPPDNSAQNKQQSYTADNQSNSKADRITTAKIRKAIIADKTLSTYAHNVKIITRNGTVTLEGPVKTDDEKQRVASDAANVVAQNRIVDHLSVKR